MTITFPARPVVGSDFEAILDSKGDVICDSDLNKQSLTFKGSGRRVVTLGNIADIGFYSLTFSDVVMGEEQMALISVFAPLRDSPKPTSATIANLEKSLVNMRAPLAKWDALVPLWRTVQCRGDELSRQDRIDSVRLYGQYFTPAGLGNEHLLGAELTLIASNLVHSLQTDLGTVAGRQVRYELNRGLSCAGSTADTIARQRASGAMALLMGTDAAISAGANTDGKLLLKLATDATNSITNGSDASLQNSNFTRLLYGMATGYGRDGVSMPSAGFALRGVGLVFGALPPDKRLIVFGNDVISPAFSCGCNLSRQFQLYTQLRPVLPTEPSLLHKCVEGLGYWLPPGINRQLNAVSVAHAISEIVQANLALLKNVHAGNAYKGSVFGLLVYPKDYGRNVMPITSDVVNRVSDVLLAEKTLLGKINNSRSVSLTAEAKNLVYLLETEHLALNIYVRRSTVLESALIEKLNSIDALVFDVDKDGTITPRRLQP